MANITKTWSIVSMAARPSVDGMQDVLSVVDWKLVVSADTGEQVEHSGSSRLGLPTADGIFVDYNTLTEEQVVEWVKEAVGLRVVEKLEATLTSMLFDQLYPITRVNTLPWMTEAANG